MHIRPLCSYSIQAASCSDYRPAAKVGILPFFRDVSGTMWVLVYRPVARREPGALLPFQMARGSREARMPNGQWQALRGKEAVLHALKYHLPLEPTCDTALREAREELGLVSDNIRILYDVGVVAHKDYGIYLYAAEINDPNRLDTAPDAQEVGWFCHTQLRHMTQQSDFKEGYLILLEAIFRVFGSSVHP